EYGGRTDSQPQERNPMGDNGTTNTTTTRTDEMFRSLEAQLTNKTLELTSVTKERDELKVRADRLDGKVEELKKQKERADAAETALTKLKGGWGEAVRARVALERRCAPAHPPGFRMDALDDDALMRATLKRLDSGADISTAVSSEKIAGKLEIKLDELEAHARSKAQIAEVMHTQEVQTPKARHDAEQKERWKKPLPNSVHGQHTRATK